MQTRAKFATIIIIAIAALSLAYTPMAKGQSATQTSNASQSSSQSYQTTTTTNRTYPVATPSVLYAIAASAGITLFLVFVTAQILRKGKLSLRFGDIIRDDDDYPSLATFQFLLWTTIIIFAFFAVSLIRIAGGFLEAPTSIPVGILGLMGISTAVPVINGGVSGSKYPEAALPPKSTKLPGFSTMLQENDRPSLTRFQMFSWTWISVMIYLIIFFSHLADPHMYMDVSKLVLPDIDPTLVILMGLSQGGYLGGKISSSTPLKIKFVIPNYGNRDKVVHIVGFDFGKDKGTVVFRNNAERDYTADDKNVQWVETKIDVTLPDLASLPSDEYSIRIVARGTEAWWEKLDPDGTATKQKFTVPL